MPLSLDMPLPVKGIRASFDPDQARWRSLGHLQQLIAPMPGIVVSSL